MTSISKKPILLASCLLVVISMQSPVYSQFFYVGGSGGDFFLESNWNSAANGSGTTPAIDTINPGVGTTLQLIIDGDNVTAEGDLTVGSGGSLSLLTGSELNVINVTFNSQFSVGTGGMFSLTDARLNVADDVFLRGTNHFMGGTVESFGDDIEFITSDIFVDGTSFIADDSIIVRAEVTPAAGSSFVNATLHAKSRLGIREFDFTVRDTTITLVADLEDVFSTDLDTATATLTMLGASSLTADQVQEGVRVVIDDQSIVTLTNEELEPDDDELSWLTQAGTRVTLNSPDARLVLVNQQVAASDMQIFNGVTGLSYAEDSSTWDPDDWNGTDGVTLSITSVPVVVDPDFNSDNEVDGTDFLIWQRGEGLTGQTDNSNGDANGDGTVNVADLSTWELGYGLPANSVAATLGVPEPTSLFLFSLLGSHLLGRRVPRTRCEWRSR